MPSQVLNTGMAQQAPYPKEEKGRKPETFGASLCSQRPEKGMKQMKKETAEGQLNIRGSQKIEGNKANEQDLSVNVVQNKPQFREIPTIREVPGPAEI